MSVGRRGRFVGIATIVIALTSVLSCALDNAFDPGDPADFAIGTNVHGVQVGGLYRSYILHVPLHRPAPISGTTPPYSLYIVLHGSSANGGDIEATSNMDSLSEANRFLVAYPDGIRGGGGLFPADWNAGGGCCGASGREGIDDLGFISALVAQIGTSLPVNAHRIYVIGFSDGGRMAYHVACQLAPLIAGIGVVAGALEDDQCAPTLPVPVIAIHGTDDDEVPYDETAATAPAQPILGVGFDLPPSVQFWIAHNGCLDGGTVAQAALDVVRTSLTPCTGALVTFYSIAGGIHAWPGEPYPGPGSDPPMSEVSASAVITQFLRTQVRK